MTKGSQSSRSPLRHDLSGPWSVAVACAIALYPRSIRLQDGAEIRAVVGSRLCQARHRGRLAGLATGVAELSDLLRTAVVLRLGGGSISRSPRNRFGRQRDMIRTLLSDFRYAWRSLRRRPAFALVVVAILAVGIGASTAMFTVFDSAILNPLPFRDAGRIVELWRGMEGGGMVTSWSQEDVRFWRESGAFEDVIGWDYEEVDLTGLGEPRAVSIALVDPETVKFLGVRPVHGRDFVAEDGIAGAEAVALVSRALARQLAADPSAAVGMALELDGEPHRVVGVMPSGFTFPFQGVEAWAPVSFVGHGSRRADLRPRVYGRVHPGLSPDATADRATGLATAAGRDVRLITKRPADLWNDTRGALTLLLAGVAMLLVSACANTANLMLAAFTEREREVALRTALGAGRGRLVRQSLMESVLLATAGGLAGTLIARVLIGVVMDVAPRQVAFFTANAVDIDLRALAFTVALSLATALLFGALPAWRGSRQDPGDALAGARGSTDARNRRLRHGLVVAEVALAVVLLVGAGLLTGSLSRLARSDLGHDQEGLYVVKLRPSSSRYPTPREQFDLGQAVAARLQAVPGVESVSVSSGLPLDGVDSYHFGLAPEAEGEPVQEADPELILPSIRADARYFETLGIPLVAGRGFRPEELVEASNAVILGRSLAARYFADGDAVGRRFRLLAEDDWTTVVGVAEEVRTAGVDEPLGPMEIYFPLDPSRVMDRTNLLVRASSAGALSDNVRAAVAAVDPLQPVESIASVEQTVWNQLTTERFYLSLAGTFAVAAMLLAALGLYGVISYTVAQRTREIGIRMALGARRADVRRITLRLSLRLAGAGVLLGLVVSLWVSASLEAYLYQITPNDPLTLALVGGGMLVLALAATWWPMRQALRVDPMQALRAE